MTEYTAKRNAKRCPTHPGAVLREDVLPAVKRPKTEIADLLGISRQQLNAILSEKKANLACRRRAPWKAVRQRPWAVGSDARRL